MTTQLDLIPPLPQGKLRFPPEPILREAEIEDNYRWTLRRAWGAGPCILWCGLNPSNADGKRDDPTTLRMIGFSYRWGFGSMIVTNVYPFISSTTDKLRAWRKTFDWKTYEANGMRPWGWDKSSWSAFHHNIGMINDLIRVDTICVAAWGAGADEADVQQFTEGVRLGIDDSEFVSIGIPIEWKCLGKNADGSPIHPLARGRYRVPDDTKLQPWSTR